MVFLSQHSNVYDHIKIRYRTLRFGAIKETIHSPRAVSLFSLSSPNKPFRAGVAQVSTSAITGLAGCISRASSQIFGMPTKWQAVAGWCPASKHPSDDLSHWTACQLWPSNSGWPECGTAPGEPASWTLIILQELDLMLGTGQRTQGSAGGRSAEYNLNWLAFAHCTPLLWNI